MVLPTIPVGGRLRVAGVPGFQSVLVVGRSWEPRYSRPWFCLVRAYSHQYPPNAYPYVEGDEAWNVRHQMSCRLSVHRDGRARHLGLFSNPWWLRSSAQHGMPRLSYRTEERGLDSTRRIGVHHEDKRKPDLLCLRGFRAGAGHAGRQRRNSFGRRLRAQGALLHEQRDLAWGDLPGEWSPTSGHRVLLLYHLLEGNLVSRVRWLAFGHGTDQGVSTGHNHQGAAGQPHQLDSVEPNDIRGFHRVYAAGQRGHRVSGDD